MPRKTTFTPRRFLRKIRQLGNFDVSPDGRWLAYSANKGEQWAVYVRDLRNGRERNLIRSDQSVTNPEFSPDGHWIAVQSDFEGDENYNIYVAPTRGGPARKLTDTPADSAFPPLVPRRHEDRVRLEPRTRPREHLRDGRGRRTTSADHGRGRHRE